MTADRSVDRDRRRKGRKRAVERSFPPQHVDVALGILDLMELAWHDVYGEVTPSGVIIDDVLLIAQGDIAGLAAAAHMAVREWRDVRVSADDLRKERRRKPRSSR